MPKQQQQQQHQQQQRQQPTRFAWLRVYALALLANQAVTPHWPVITPEHSSRIDGLMRMRTPSH